MSFRLSQSDYARMAGIISAVIEATGAAPARGCVSFAVAGAWILRQVYGKLAVPVAGAAFYRVDDQTGFTMAYGHYLQGEVISEESAFHCWIVCEGQAIDLAAPLIPDNLALSGRTEVVPRRMFQRPLAEMAASPAALAFEGDFFLEPNLALSQKLLSAYLDDPSYLELARVCADWFEQPARGQADTFRIPGPHGSRELRRHDLAVDGCW